MSQFNKILFPINGNPHAVEYALDMAKRSNAELYLLKTYRLVEEMHQLQSENKSLKRSIDDKIEEEINEKYSRLLDESGVRYKLMIEVGFLFDRILSNIREKSIDMLLLDGVQRRGEDHLVDRFSDLKIPVLIIPEKEKQSTLTQ